MNDNVSTHGSSGPPLAPRGRNVDLYPIRYSTLAGPEHERWDQEKRDLTPPGVEGDGKIKSHRPFFTYTA